jgi:transcriptional regulator with XRE-family HTH domain
VKSVRLDELGHGVMVSLAEDAGLAPSNYARLEASKHQPRVETLVRVAKALGVPLADLVRTEPESHRVSR